MRINHRIARLEDRLQVGTNKDGSCKYCTGREKELGRVVVFNQDGDGPKIPKEDPTPTPCPRCGRNVNTHIIIHRVDLIAKRRAEGGWLAADKATSRDW